MTTFTHNGKLELNQTWKISDMGTVVIKCPNGHVGVLDDHSITPGGIVEPSVVCPYDTCDFHDRITLFDFPSDFSGLEIFA